MTTHASTATPLRTRPSTLTLLFIVGSLMTMAALATDVMLPAFPTMAAELGVSDAAIQRVLSVFMLGYALPHLLVGSTADRFGRRPVLLTGMVIYAIGSIICLFANDFNTLLIGRFVQGLGCATGPVLARAVLRDLYSGRQLGRMMSFAMIFFTAAPLLAPSIGVLLLSVGDWHLQFVFLLAIAAFMLVLVLRLLPETLPRRDLTALSITGLVANVKSIFRERQSAWAIVVLTLAYTPLMAYLASAPSIFIDHYALSEAQFGLVFAAIASVSFITQPLNARLLNSFSAAQILRVVLPLWLLACVVLAVQVTLGIDSIWSFAANMSAFFAGFSMTLANTMTLVLEPHFERAGMVSGISGFTQLSIGTLVGSVIAFFATGGPQPLALGMVLLVGLSLLAFRQAVRPAATVA